MLKKLLRAALLALLATPIVSAPVLAAQATYSTPAAGPMSFGTFVSTYLNPALAAILSNNSGTTAPAVTGQPGAYEWWVDTSTTPRVLKLYDGASWLAFATIDATGHVLQPTGAALKLLGSTSGSTLLQPSAAASGTLTLPAATDTLVGRATTDTLTNKTLTAPVLVTPDLGTPSAGTLTNATGLPIATGVSGLGTGIATALATPSSANLRIAITDETGSGSAVFATSPVLVTPNLGTPSAATLTNGTGLPVGTGIAGLGTGVATVLGTPSSANWATALTDETGSGAAVFATSPTLVSPTLGAASGTSLSLSTPLGVTSGGTGAATLTGVLKGNGTSALSPAIAGTDFYAPGGLDVALSDGGTGASTASVARGNLGLAIGTDVQAFNGRLADVAGASWAQGDLLYFNGTNLVRLGAGTSGQFLKTQGTAANPLWATIPGGGDMLAANNLSDLASIPTARTNLGLGTPVATKSATYTVVTGDRSGLLVFDASGGARTANLPAAATAGVGFEITVKKSDSSINTVTIDASGSETIDGALTYVLRLANNSVKLRSDGTGWQIVESHLPSETGSNTNGTYVRNADGTQTCWFDGTALNSNTAFGNGFLSSTTATWTFPAAFVTTTVTPVVTGVTNSTGRLISADEPSGTSVNYQQVSSNSSNTTRPSHLMATGRWF